MKIQGLQKTTLLDYPGHVAATVFTGGCNFKCPFCHNALLVTEMDQQEYTEDYSYDGYGNESYQRTSYKDEQPSAIDRVKIPLIIGMLLLVVLLIGVFRIVTSG